MSAGRPTKYDPKYCDEIIEYFSVKPYEQKLIKVPTKNGTIDQFVEEASDFPNFAGFAVKIGVHRETLRNWCEENPEFFAAYKKAQELQEQWIVTNGMRSNINVPFGIFIAKNTIGYKDRVEQTVEQSKPFQFNYTKPEGSNDED